MQLRLPGVVLLGVAVVAAPVRSAAETAVIKVLEAPVRAAPEDGAPVVLVFVGARVSIEGEAEAGYRRVRLPDGSAGWIRESALALVPETPAAATAAATPPDLGARFVLKDAYQLEAFTKGDRVIFEKAERLSKRRSFTQTMGTLGGITSALLFLRGVAGMDDSDESSSTYFVAGLGAAAATAAIVAFVSPRRAEMEAVVEEWNARHPERPAALPPPRR